MTTEELLNICKLEEITPEKLAKSEPFECENRDLNEFFACDAVNYAKRLLGKTIVVRPRYTITSRMVSIFSSKTKDLKQNT